MLRTILVIAAIAGLTSGANPLMTKYADMQSPCVKQCSNDVVNMSTSVDFTKNTNFGDRFSRLNEVCKNISVARECVAKCKVSFNMFDMKAMKVICEKKTITEFKKHEACLAGKGQVVNKICDNRCGGKAKKSQLATVMGASTTTDDLRASMKAAGESCELSRCHARCSRDTFKELCKESDPTASVFMQKYVEDVLKAINDDFTELGMRTIIKAMMPKQCRFIFRPQSLFDDSPETDQSGSSEDVLAALLQTQQ